MILKSAPRLTAKIAVSGTSESLLFLLFHPRKAHALNAVRGPEVPTVGGSVRLKPVEAVRPRMRRISIARNNNTCFIRLVTVLRAVGNPSLFQARPEAGDL